jgi:hypothetical protein
MLMRLLAAFAGLWTIVAAVLVAPGAATAATSSGLDLVASSGVQTHVHLSQIGSEFGVEPGVYLYGTGSTGMNAVTEHIIAPGGTELDPTSLNIPICTWVTPKIEAWCVVQGEDVQVGAGPTFYGQLMRLKFLSVPVTPGLFEVQCACDSNPSNNRAPITFIVDDPTPSPTPPAAATTPTAHPTTAVRTAQPTPTSHPTTAMPPSTADPTASASASAGTEVVAPNTSSTSPAASAEPSVIDLSQASVTGHQSSLTTPIMIVLSAVFVAGGVVGTMILLRRRGATR